MPLSKADEARAARLVIESTTKAYRQMVTTINRQMMKYGSVDKKFLNQAMRNLDRLSEEYATKLVKGRYGTELKRAMKKAAAEAQTSAAGAAALAGMAALTSLTLDSVIINQALFNAKVNIKGATAEGVKIVNEIMTRGITTGASHSAIADSLRYHLVINKKRLTFARANMIARNEMHSVQRQATFAKAEELGVKHFEMMGPADNRSADICLNHVGQTKTAKAWNAVSPTTFQYGLHYGCRHSWPLASGPAKRDANREAKADAQLKSNEEAEAQKKAEKKEKK